MFGTKRALTSGGGIDSVGVPFRKKDTMGTQVANIIRTDPSTGRQTADAGAILRTGQAIKDLGKLREALKNDEIQKRVMVCPPTDKDHPKGSK